MPATPDRHVRVNTGVLALAEKRALVWMAERLPAWINSDHLTALGFAAMAAAGGAFWMSRFWRPALLLAILALAVNWFGDSLDGTVARVRHHERPRYGFYLDHVLDIGGISLLLGGMALSGLMSPVTSSVVLICYLLVSAEVFLATAVRSEFRMSFLNLGPTELRIFLAIGTLMVFLDVHVTIALFGPFRLFDVGGIGAAVGLIAAFVTSAVRNGAALYREEPLRSASGKAAAVLLVLAAIAMPRPGDAATLRPETVKAWNAHVVLTEARIERELAVPRAAAPCAEPRGSITSIPGGLVHDWRGCIFLPNVTLDHLLDRLQHPTSGWPRQQDVVSLRVTERHPDALKVFIRMTRRKIVTVTYNTEHDVTYRRHGPAVASSRSISTRIAELDDAGTRVESEKPPGEDRGYMWRLNSYWRYEQVGSGVIVDLESLTLSRDVPRGLGFIVQPIIASIARESMERTLESIREPPPSALATRVR